VPSQAKRKEPGEAVMRNTEEMCRFSESMRITEGMCRCRSFSESMRITEGMGVSAHGGKGKRIGVSA
jgi:hypothetical protein